jgi:hypothetical protein
MLQPKKSNKRSSRNKKSKTQDSLAEDIFEIFDPTGMSSYDDVYRSYKKEGLFSLGTGLEVLGALPVIGKAGKGLKAIRTANKYIEGLNKVNKLVAKAEKVVPAVLKEGKNVGRSIQRASRGGRANPIAAASMGVGIGAESLQKLTKIIEKGTGKVLDKVITKAPRNKAGIITTAATLNTTNTLSDVAGAVQGQLPKKEESSKTKKSKVVYYNTNPKRGKVEKPGDEEGVKYVPVSNSVQLEKWKAQNNVPVTSDLKTKVTREVLGTLMPDQAAQFLTAIATKDNKLGLQDLTPDIQEALIKSVKNAQKRTGKDSGGTQYIDYSPEVEQAFQGMSAGKKQMISTDPAIQAATMLGRVSYKKNALGETEIYDSYDFSKTDPEKADTFYKKVRAYAGTALPDDGKKPNLIGKIPVEELAFGTGDNGIGDPPTRLAFENELMSKVITERNKDKNFVQRALNPSDYPMMINEDGSKTTHLMQYSTDNEGNAFVSPSVIQDELGLLSKLTPREAVKYGRQSGEEIEIPNVELAEYYTQNGLIKHGYGTNSQGIMKTKMNPRKKYANGTSNVGSNYIVSPAEALNDYNIQMAKVEAKAMSNPWIPIVAAVGGAAQSFVGRGINANVLKPGESANNGDTYAGTAGDNNSQYGANGINNVQADVEVEGGEMYETPQGQVGEFEGPAHEQGGIPLEVGEDVEEGTKVYSDRLKVGNKTLAERKATRERQTANLEKIASQALVDQAVKNAAKRKMMAIEKEEMADLDFQEKVNNMQAMADTMVAAFGTGMAGLQDNPIGDSMEYGYGTGSKGVMKYYSGTPPEGIVYGKGYNADMFKDFYAKYNELNPGGVMDMNFIQSDIGIANNAKGFGKMFGPATYKASQNWLAANKDKSPDGYVNPIVSTGKENAPGFVRGFGMNLEEGEQFLQEDFREDPGEAGFDAEEDAAFYTRGQVGTPKGEKKQSKAGKFMGSIPGVGDLTKMFGNYLGMTAGIKTAGEQRASDITHTNVYKNAGDESQKLLDNAKQGIEVSKAQAIVKATSTSRGGKRGGRNSARGVNQMRGMDWLYDTALNQQIAEISAGAAQQISGIDVQKSGVAMNADQLKGKGEYDAAMANEAAKDAYYTALGKGRNQFAEGLMQTGKDLNDMKESKMKWNMQKKSGTYVQGEDDGTLSNKDIVYTDENGKKVSIPRAEFEKLLKQQKSKLT